MTQAPGTADDPWPVRTLARELRDYINRLGQVWVAGEITQWGGSGRNVYGKLKDSDEDATVSFVIWASTRAQVPDDLGQGSKVAALIKPNYWLKGGTLTMQVLAMRHVGIGDLLEQLEKLRKALAAEGLFDPERKKRLPFLPQCIGLVTARGSDAEKDVKRNAQLRWPSVRFREAYASVQGQRTVAEVTAAVRRLDADDEVDVIIVARGGGDFQNLLGFSDESLLRTIAACTTPVVSAIGHEADRPLLDEVADLRASTPTDAAKRVVPDVAEERAGVQQARARLSTRLTQLVSREIERIEQLRTRPALSSGTWIITDRSEEITHHVARAAELIDRRLEREDQSVDHLTARLRALSPQSTLQRGYAIVQGDGGAVVTDVASAPAGTALTVTLAAGRLGATSQGPVEAAGTTGTMRTDGVSPDTGDAVEPTAPDESAESTLRSTEER